MMPKHQTHDLEIDTWHVAIYRQSFDIVTCKLVLSLAPSLVWLEQREKRCYKVEEKL